MKNFKAIIIISALCLSGIYASLPKKISEKTPTVTKYDMYLELDHIKLEIVKDMDGKENFRSGTCYMKFFSAKCNSKTNLKSRVFGITGDFSVGKVDKGDTVNLFTNLTLDELKNTELTIGGHLEDDETFGGNRVFTCMDCINRGSSRVLKFIEFPTTQASITKLATNGTFQRLKFGEDDYVELNFYENGNKNDGWTKSLWRVWVKPHN